VTPTWIEGLLQGPLPQEGQSFDLAARRFVIHGGLVRDLESLDVQQKQTRDTFAFKWGKQETYRSDGMRAVIAPWLRERYGDLVARLHRADDSKPLVLDAGCGAGNAASILFETSADAIRYVGVDISEAVDLARERLAPLFKDHLFLQADLMSLPFPDQSFDLVLSEGALHHTSSTKRAVEATARFVRPGGIYAAYVYRKKSPVREFTDDYIRAHIADLSPSEAWETIRPLTKLGKALGDLNIEIDVPDDVTVLGIPKGRIDVQRLFYWHVCKLFHRPELSIDEMNHINFDWFMPKYCHRQTPEEVQSWCEAAGLKIEKLKVEDAGITAIARRPAVS
jgi:SAM-dependent methyltransferase